MGRMNRMKQRWPAAFRAAFQPRRASRSADRESKSPKRPTVRGIRCSASDPSDSSVAFPRCLGQVGWMLRRGSGEPGWPLAVSPGGSSSRRRAPRRVFRGPSAHAPARPRGRSGCSCAPPWRSGRRCRSRASGARAVTVMSDRSSSSRQRASFTSSPASSFSVKTVEALASSSMDSSIASVITGIATLSSKIETTPPSPAVLIVTSLPRTRQLTCTTDSHSTGLTFPRHDPNCPAGSPAGPARRGRRAARCPAGGRRWRSS